MAINSKTPEYLGTIQEARASLGTFESLYRQYRSNLGVYFAFKAAVLDGDETAYLWYSPQAIEDGVFHGQCFETPKELKQHSKIQRSKDDIYDWMINDHGVLYGGFSIRYQRSKVADSKKTEFDEYSGIKEYKDL